MADDSLTTRVLIEIRDEIRQTNARIDQTNARLDRSTTRLESAIERLRDEVKGEFLELEVRQSTRVMQQSAILLDLRAVFADRFELRERIERREQEIAELRKARG
ncbi:MAG: hypothetical protein JNL83_25430 [Myxococcales bacterium]|nr:hypothetical protein [Myxococcales bacterium]